MKKALFFLQVILILILNSCSASKEVSEKDILLRKNIIGTWHSENYEAISFKEDGKFVDTLLKPVSLDKLVYIPDIVLEGKFYIKEGLLHFEEPIFTYLNLESDNSVSFYKRIFYPRTIRFEDSDLFLQEIPILSNDEYENKLIGKWEIINPVSTYEKNAQEKYKTGNIKETYIFNDSLELKYKNDFLFDTDYPESNLTTNFTFNKNKLIFSSNEIGATNFIGLFYIFENEKMYWYISDPVYYQRVE